MRDDFTCLLYDLEIPPPLTDRQAGLCVLLRARLKALAGDVWVLAQKSPALVADPALVALAGPMLGDLRRLLRKEPGVHLLPRRLPERITLHALAVALRRMQRELEVFLLRRRPEIEPQSDPFDASTAAASQTLAEVALKITQRLADKYKDPDDEDEPEAEPVPPPPVSRNARRKDRRGKIRIGLPPDWRPPGQR